MMLPKNKLCYGFPTKTVGKRRKVLNYTSPQEKVKQEEIE